MRSDFKTILSNENSNIRTYSCVLNRDIVSRKCKFADNFSFPQKNREENGIENGGKCIQGPGPVPSRYVLYNFI